MKNLDFHEKCDLDFPPLGTWLISKIWGCPSGKSKKNINSGEGTSNFHIRIVNNWRKTQISHPRSPISDSPYDGYIPQVR